jgi:hypothetical protein
MTSCLRCDRGKPASQVWRPHLSALIAALAVLLAAPGAAETADDRTSAAATIFAADAFTALPTGTRLGYVHSRSHAPVDARVPDIDAGRADLAIEAGEDGARQLRLTLTEDGRTRPVPPFPAEAGHPVLIVFLETMVRTMATLTGGNAYYIRNRIREALWEGGAREAVTLEVAGAPADGERTTIRPFVADPNRDRMGPFAELELAFVLSEAVPGRVARLEATAGADGAGFRESFVFDKTEGAD